MCSFDLYGFMTTKCDTTNTKWKIEPFKGKHHIYYCAKVVTDDEYAEVVCGSLMEYFETEADATQSVNKTKIEEYKPNG